MASEYRISAEHAARIVKNLREASGSNVNVIGEGGVILASSSPERVGTVHEGGKRIMAGDCDEIAISAEMAAAMPGTRPGYNGVVMIGDRRVAVIGISGDPEILRPLTKVAAIAVREEVLNAARHREEIRRIVSMKAQVADVAERMKVVALNGSILAAKLGDKGRSFKIVVAEIKKLAEGINQLIENFSED